MQLESHDITIWFSSSYYPISFVTFLFFCIFFIFLLLSILWNGGLFLQVRSFIRITYAVSWRHSCKITQLPIITHYRTYTSCHLHIVIQGTDQAELYLESWLLSLFKMRSLIKCFIRLASGSLDCIMAGRLRRGDNRCDRQGPNPYPPYINS